MKAIMCALLLGLLGRAAIGQITVPGDGGGPFISHDIGSTLSDYADYGPYKRSSVIHGIMGKLDYGIVDVYTWSTSWGNTSNRTVVSQTVTIWVLRKDYNGAPSFKGRDHQSQFGVWEWESPSGLWLTGYAEAGTVCHIEGSEW